MHIPEGLTLDDLLALGEEILPGAGYTPTGALSRGNSAADTLDPLRLAAAIAKLAPSKAQVLRAPLS